MTDRQKEIVLVSLNIIANDGIQGLTIKNIAKKIGISEPAIYRHYENKIQILVAILDFFKSNSVQFMEKDLVEETSSILKMERFFVNNFKMFTENPSLVVVIFAEEIFRSEPELHQKVREIRHAHSANILSIVEVGQKSGEIRADVRADQIAIMMMGTFRLFVQKWQMSNHAFSLEKEGGDLMKSISQLLKA